MSRQELRKTWTCSWLSWRPLQTKSFWSWLSTLRGHRPSRCHSWKLPRKQAVVRWKGRICLKLVNFKLFHLTTTWFLGSFSEWPESMKGTESAQKVARAVEEVMSKKTDETSFKPLVKSRQLTSKLDSDHTCPYLMVSNTPGGLVVSLGLLQHLKYRGKIR